MAEEGKGASNRSPKRNGMGDFLKAFEDLAGLYGERAADLALESDSVPLVNHYTSVHW